ncbi:hypothetical protein F2Q69_00034909 [Brassica cretica]|uniref:Uncharacterized protein n=1 Tax=Brassica cretica TaxID=69181 RepID=A0A8S9SKT8_BRACR|nr:hypothetical protein F2Q69_00034909 [Brassica cretica]
MLAAGDPGLLPGQLLMFYPIVVFFFLGHGFFEGRVMPSRLVSRSSWVDVSTVVRVLGLVAYIQVDALDFFSFIAPGRRWKVLRSWLCTWLERFIRVAVELRFSDDHVYPPAGTIVSMVILPSSAFLARLICACVPLGRLFISPGRAVEIQDEVFYASDLREVASEEFCG